MDGQQANDQLGQRGWCGDAGKKEEKNKHCRMQGNVTEGGGEGGGYHSENKV